MCVADLHLLSRSLFCRVIFSQISILSSGPNVTVVVFYKYIISFDITTYFVSIRNQITIKIN